MQRFRGSLQPLERIGGRARGDRVGFLRLLVAQLDAGAPRAWASTSAEFEKDTGKPATALAEWRSLTQYVQKEGQRRALPDV
jgi:hypothetical protein